MGDITFGAWLFFGFIAFVIYALSQYDHGGGNKVCKTCGFQGLGKSVVSGNIAIEIILWICFLIPGLIYSIWRWGSRHTICPACGGDDIIPASSPIGQKIISDTRKSDDLK